MSITSSFPAARPATSARAGLHLHTIRSPRLDFFSRYPSRYRLILNTQIVLDMLDDIRPDIIESGDPYHLAWTCLRAGSQLHAPVFGFYHSHFPEAYLRTALKYGGSWVRDAVLNYAEDYIVKLYGHFAATLVPSEHLRQLPPWLGPDQHGDAESWRRHESLCARAAR